MVTSDGLKTFGAAVRKARVEAGWTLSKLADEAFANSDRKGFVSQIELGKRQITPLTAGKLAEALALKDDVLDLILKNDPPADDAPTAEDTRAAQLLAATEKEGDPGIGETLLIALAYEYADTNTADLKLAYNDLKAALDAAREMKARAALPDNTGDGVAAVRAEVLRLNEEEGPEAGGEYLDDAIARKSAEMGALLELGAKQDRVRNDPKAAAEKLMMKLRMEVAADGLFERLRDLRNEWYVRGRDGGLNFEAAVAIHLAQASVGIAAGYLQKGTAFNDLGIALETLGGRESGTDGLEQAVTAYRAALEELAREKVPLDWALTQNNLGNVLLALGERESGTDRLEQAVAAYRAALEERTREKVPLGWAMTQNNLSNVLLALGERESGTDRLEQAVAAYRAALEERTREKVPLGWAMTQNNLGNALAALGERESGTDRLEQAVTAYRAALEEWTRDKVPLDWAMTQNNLGTALQTLGERESNTDMLEQAVTAYREALEEWTHDKVPLQWAGTQNNLGNALQSLGERESDTDRLEQAVTAYRAALEEWTREKVPLNWATTQNNLGNALQSLGQRQSGTDMLEQAIAAYTAALEERTHEKVPLDWAVTQENVALAQVVFFERTQDAKYLDQAMQSARNAQEVYLEAQAEFYIEKVARLIAHIDALRAGRAE